MGLSQRRLIPDRFFDQLLAFQTLFIFEVNDASRPFILASRPSHRSVGQVLGAWACSSFVQKDLHDCLINIIIPTYFQLSHPNLWSSISLSRRSHSVLHFNPSPPSCSLDSSSSFSLLSVPSSFKPARLHFSRFSTSSYSYPSPTRTFSSSQQTSIQPHTMLAKPSPDG